MQTVILDGNTLKIKDIYALIRDKKIKIKIAPKALRVVRKCKAFLDKVSTHKVIYGVNTGFGPMASHIVGRDQLEELQMNLIRSHATGMGEPIKSEFVLATMVVRLNTLIKGNSGVSEELVKRLEKFINLRILPIIPEHGAVGTSGDLVQLAHIALALIGEGDVEYKGEVVSTRILLKKLYIPPYKLKPKEGLSLINGTSTMAGITSLLCVDAHRLLSLAIRNGALSLELVHGLKDSISKKLHDVRPHKGQKVVARTIREILRSSRSLETRRRLQSEVDVNHVVHKVPKDIQEVYSLRCIPQILGPIFDTLEKTWRDVEIEINSTTDNPIIDWENHSFLHGGNFHGDYIAASVDQLKAAIVKLTMLSERRANFFLNHKINKRFPPFINLNQPGLTLGLQGLQFVATSTTAHSQSLAYPHHLHSISTNADNQDVVSMGTDAALFADKVIENAYIVVAIELITLTQAVDFQESMHLLSNVTKRLCKKLRTVFPKVYKDRTMVHELKKVLEVLKNEYTLDVEFTSNGK